VQAVIRQLGAIDVSMEHFGARDNRPKDECLRLVKEETDIFIGIYAHKYGFIPEGDDISITEAEYEEARTARLPILIYILDDSTPWIPRLIDRGRAAKQLQTLKVKLKLFHICAFFSNKDQLAAKVAADLGRHFARGDYVAKEVSAALLDPAREQRLIEQMRSADKHEVKRAIRALIPSQSPWFVDALKHLVLGEDENLAEESIWALGSIRGRNSAEVITVGLSSPRRFVRAAAANTMGEMALRGRQHDAELVIDALIEASQNPAEDGMVLYEIVHGIAKIGGQKAYDALINILKSENVPPFLKGTALRDACSFWVNPLRDRFILDALSIVQTWPVTICKGVVDSPHFYTEMRIEDALRARIRGKEA
jgi:hypothetical protein